MATSLVGMVCLRLLRLIALQNGGLLFPSPSYPPDAACSMGGTSKLSGEQCVRLGITLVRIADPLLRADGQAKGFHGN